MISCWLHTFQLIWFKIYFYLYHRSFFGPTPSHSFSNVGFLFLRGGLLVYNAYFFLDEAFHPPSHLFASCNRSQCKTSLDQIITSELKQHWTWNKNHKCQQFQNVDKLVYITLEQDILTYKWHHCPSHFKLNRSCGFGKLTPFTMK